MSVTAVSITVGQENGYVCINWEQTKMRLTPAVAVQLAHKLTANALDLAKEVINQ